MEIQFSKEVSASHRKRYDLFLSLVNQIWNLEKEKLPLRKRLVVCASDIDEALKWRGSSDRDGRTIGANLGVLREIKKTTEDQINKIRENQKKQLKEIENAFNLIDNNDQQGQSSTESRPRQFPSPAIRPRPR